MFPRGVSKAVLEYIIFDKVRKETLQESFYNYISANEKNVIQQCLQRRSVDDEIVQGLCDTFSDCGITNLPSPSNIQVMISGAGKKVFIRKPFFVLKNIKIGLGEFWKVTLKEIDTIWNLEVPTPTNVLKTIVFSGVKTRSDEIVTSHFQRYINSSSLDNIELSLQFATGCTTINRSEKIKIEFVNQDSRHLNIASKTCFKISYIPRRIDSFNLFEAICDQTLQNDN